MARAMRPYSLPVATDVQVLPLAASGLRRMWPMMSLLPEISQAAISRSLPPSLRIARSVQPLVTKAPKGGM